jgi:cell division protease FtsH
MVLESWLPIGFELPDGARCGKTQHEGPDWQIVESRGGGTVLLAKPELVQKWISSGLIDSTELLFFDFGDTKYFEVSSSPSQLLAPVVDCKAPGDKNEALAFAMALNATRQIDSESPLQDAIYVERFSRLLPTYGISSRVEDDVVFGYWLTGGVSVSAKSSRRLRQLMGWLGPKHLKDVVSAAGFVNEDPAENHSSDSIGAEAEHVKADVIGRRNSDAAADVENGKTFVLPGRPELEAFFNEHVVDIIQNQERYKALGIGFPSAIVLHGPPGCGKTFAVEQLVEFLGWPSFQIDASSVASPYIHETSKKVAEVFEKAMKNAPSVLVIDEMEAFLADRESGGGGSHHRVEEVAEFLRRIPEATQNEVLIVAMTNRIEMIDSAILRRGRFDHVIKVDYASEDEVGELLEKLLSTLPKEGSVDSKALARKLAGRPLSDVAFVVREGARLAARASKDKLEQAFLNQALDSAPSRDSDGAGRRIGFI